MRHLVRFTAKTNGRPPEGMISLLRTAYESLSIRKPDFADAPAMTLAVGVEQPEEVNLFVSVYADADDDDEAVAAVQALQTALTNFGIETVGPPELRSSRVVEPVVISGPGIEYDEATEALTLDTWGPEWTDVDLNLYSEKDGRVAIVLNHYQRGRVLTQVAMVKTIKIRRPGGRPPESGLGVEGDSVQ